MKDIEQLIEIDDPKNNPDLSNDNYFETTTKGTIERLEELNDKSFENFILEWAYGYNKSQYSGGAFKFNGAGDKGRDVVCFLENKQNKNAKWVNFQCKYYKNQLAPNDIWEEIGKVLYYTFIGDYSIPEKYYFVCHKGVGPKLFDFLQSPEKLKTNLLKNWAKDWGLAKSHNLNLEGKFKKHVEDFDYSIFTHKSQMDLIEEHSKTKYFVLRFGRGAKVKRKKPLLPKDEISKEEEQLVYIQELLKAYSSFKKEKIDKLEVLEKFEKLFNHFKEQRISFYFAEQLKQFGKETFSNHADYDSLMDQVYSGIYEILEMDYEDGYKRLQSVISHSTKLSIQDHILKENIQIRDKKGICHQLVDEKKFKWCDDD